MRNLCARVRGPVPSSSPSYCPTSLSYTSRLIQLPSSIFDFIEPFLIFILSFRPPSRRSSLRLVLFRPLIFFPSHLPYRFPFRLSISIPYTSVSHFLSFAQLPLLSCLLLHYFLYTQHTISCTRCAGTYHSHLSTFISA